MANELDSQGEWQRLYERYHAMSDGELLDMAAGIDNLTETAGDVLRAELRDRRLQVGEPVGGGGASGTVWGNPLEDAGVKRGEMALMIFYDAIEAGRACDFLEEREVDFEIRDVSRPQTGMHGYNSSPVALELVVKRVDRERAMAVLRETMGLFPLQEVEAADGGADDGASIDDGSVATFGEFGEREEADEVARVLEDAGIWHRVVANTEGSAKDEDLYRIEVREMDLMRAGDVVEASLDLPED
jgi:hypothetical protein